MFDPSWGSKMQALGRGTCDGCKFWSEQIGRDTVNGMTAECLNRDSHRFAKCVNGGCDKWEAGLPIDAVNTIGPPVEEL